MPRTVDEGFRDFLIRLTPTPGESEAAKRHRESIRSCMENTYGLNRFWRTGSFGNGTSISGYSDVDYMASIPRSQLTENSTSTLRKIRNRLDRRFPDTGVKVSCPAVVVPFGTLAKETTEVTPADFMRREDGFAVYDIPNCNDGWHKSSPDAHKSYVNDINGSLGNKVKPLIRFIKAWKYYNRVPIGSFYLELRVAKYARSEKSIVYDIDVKRVLEHLQNVDLARVQDPMGISGYVAACGTVAMKEAKSKLGSAVTRARKAREAEEAGNTKEAFEWWDRLFASRFPNFYY